MNQRTRRSLARFLAPLALIAVVVAFLAIVSGSGGGSNSNGSGTTLTTSSVAQPSKTKKAATKTAATTKPAGGAKAYTVQVGDTLGSIADKTGVTLERIQALNPDVDPHAMVAGQKIKLK